MDHSLYEKIETACINGLVDCFGQLIHEKTIKRATLKQRFLDHDSSGSLTAIPVIDTRRVTHLKLSHPFNQETMEKLQALGYSEQEIQYIAQMAAERESHRLRQIKTNKDKVSDLELELKFGAQFLPLTHIPPDTLCQPRITDCGGKWPIILSEATHLPPLSLDLLQMQSYLESCVQNLCYDQNVQVGSQIYYDFHLDRQDQYKLYLFLSIVM